MELSFTKAAPVDSTDPDRPRLTIRPVTPLGNPNKAAREAIYKTELPANTRVEVVSERKDVSDLGWPIYIALLRLVDSHGSVVEERAQVLYLVLEFSASAVLQAKPNTLEIKLSEYLPLLKSGALRNKDDIVALSQLIMST
jgi:hypothetical protein